MIMNQCSPINRSRWIRPIGFVVLAFNVAVISSAFAAEHTKDSLDVVKEKLKEKKALLIDVREEKEWDAGHLADARLLPLSQLEKGVSPDNLAKTLAKDKIIYLHCAVGGRCRTAADILKKQGYDVRPLKSGYNQLLKSGFAKAEPKKEESK
jgi:rhodanese-related sulfurtransferase